jgi:hypothetical protein
MVFPPALQSGLQSALGAVDKAVGQPYFSAIVPAAKALIFAELLAAEPRTA